jgi:hypothetical protein
VPRQRFRCPRCGFVDTLFYPTPLYDSQHNRISSWPLCPDCTRRTIVITSDGPAMAGPLPELEVFPDQMQHDLLTGGTGLTVQSSTGGEVTVSSLSEIRAIERESLRRARNGDGSPIVFRGFSQSRQNMNKNTLHGSEFERGRTIPFSRTTQSGLPIKGEVVPESRLSEKP